jgi:hypothetical protein
LGPQSEIAALLAELGAFTGAGWEQDDDIAAATVERSGAGEQVPVAPGRGWSLGS